MPRSLVQWEMEMRKKNEKWTEVTGVQLVSPRSSHFQPVRKKSRLEPKMHMRKSEIRWGKLSQLHRPSLSVCISLIIMTNYWPWHKPRKQASSAKTIIPVHHQPCFAPPASLHDSIDVASNLCPHSSTRLTSLTGRTDQPIRGTNRPKSRFLVQPEQRSVHYYDSNLCCLVFPPVLPCFVQVSILFYPISGCDIRFHLTTLE